MGNFNIPAPLSTQPQGNPATEGFSPAPPQAPANLVQAAAVPMIFDDGSRSMVPQEKMQAAVQAGGKIVSPVKFDDGSRAWVTADRLHEAVAAGGRMMSMDEAMPKPSVAQRALETAKSFVTSIGQQMPHVSGSPLHPPTQEQLQGSLQEQQQAGREDEVRQQEGHGAAYRATALLGESQGVPVSAMEEGAREGDPNKVLGAATASAGIAAAPLIAEGALKAPGVARDIQNHLMPGLQLAEDASEAPRAKFAASRIAKLIKPMAGDLKYGADPAAALPKEGITGNTLEDLGEKTYARARDVGQTIDAVAQAPQNAAKVVDISAAVNRPIDEAIRNAVRTGDKPLYDKLQTLRQQVLNVWQETEDAKGNKSMEPAAPRKLQMSPMDAIRLKRDIADMTRWTGDPMDNEVNAVKARMFGSIKDTVNKAVPDLVELNQRYADLVNAGKAIERRAPVAARSNDFSLGDLGTMIAGSALTGSSGVGVAAEVARRAAHNPGVVSRVANAVMPDALKYEEPSAIRARLNAEPSAPKGAPEGGKTPSPERRQNGETGPRGHVFTPEERKTLDANHARALKETLDRLGPLTREEVITGKPVSRRAEDVLSGKAGD